MKTHYSEEKKALCRERITAKRLVHSAEVYGIKKALNLSNYKIAPLIGCYPQHVNEALHGRRCLTKKQMDKLKSLIKN